MKIGNLSEVASNKKSILKNYQNNVGLIGLLSIPYNLAVKIIATIDESVWKKCVEDYFKEKKPKTHEEAWKKLEKKLAEMEAYI